MSFLRDGTWHDVDRGGVVFMSKKSLHTFKNIGDTPSRMLIGTMPADFEKFFARCAEEFARPEGPDLKRIEAIGLESGMHFMAPL